MTSDGKLETVAGALLVSVGLLRRRLRQTQVESDLTLPETSALVRLDRGGPTTASALARLEEISQQSMGATLATLEQRALVERRPDPDDGRRAVISLTDAGRALLRERWNARAGQIAAALSSGFTRAELRQLEAAAPLIERLAQGI
ncbi:MAG TPA: MarR family transcriptional regulator [Gaiellales bacterium]|jgi:DNA-binding MarR family transcriptional regulator